MKKSLAMMRKGKGTEEEKEKRINGGKRVLIISSRWRTEKRRGKVTENRLIERVDKNEGKEVKEGKGRWRKSYCLKHVSCP